MWNRQFIFLSLVALTIGFILWRRGNYLFKKWKKSEAIVISNKFIPIGLALFEPIDPVADETGTYYSIVEFKTENGETITKQLDIGTNPPRPVGKKITIIYNPNNALDFVTYSRTMFEIIPGFLMATGLIGLMVSILDLFRVISIIPE